MKKINVISVMINLIETKKRDVLLTVCGGQSRVEQRRWKSKLNYGGCVIGDFMFVLYLRIPLWQIIECGRM